jgi:A/G-specific adenine glycosylase
MPLPNPDTTLRRALIDWQRRCGRDYPWRRTTHAFHLLSVEIFLQRTRADQVVGVFEELERVAPGPADVLEAGRVQVDDWFAALGLRWRAEHYWNLCRELVAEYGGEVPADRDALMSLPGVGQYAAGSTLTYAFGKPTGVVDSNILRVYSRYYGIEFSGSDRRKRSVHEWVDSHLPEDPDEARLYSLGLVDLGALICTPRSPDCENCPLVERCAYAARSSSS